MSGARGLDLIGGAQLLAGVLAQALQHHKLGDLADTGAATHEALVNQRFERAGHVGDPAYLLRRV
jgi:hypothetical protein